MKTGIVMVALLASAAFAQTKWDNDLKVHFRDGALLAIHTESSARNSPLSTSGSVAVGKGDVSTRVVLDKASNPIFAYDIEAKKSPQGSIALRIKPIDQEKLRKERWGPPDRKIQGDIPTLATSRAFPLLRPGDSVQVDILYHPDTGEKIWDVLKVIDEPLPGAAEPKRPAGNVFSFESVRVDLNGQTIHKPGNWWLIGDGMKMSVPQKGDYYLTLNPSPNFPYQASGWVDRTVLRFKVGADQFEVTGKSNLLQKSDHGTVWVFHDAESATEASAKRTTVEFSSAGNVEWLMPPRLKKKE
jgi:hypothetical protein